MADYRKVKSSKIYMGRLSHDADLLEELTAVCIKEGITLGRVEAIGAIKKGKVGYYDQSKREYAFLDLNGPLEITALKGNISLKEGTPFVHAHVTLSDNAGQCFGGHLAPGTIIFACEFIIHSFEGEAFERHFDEVTRLPLWKI
ncbi:MAG: DNA-binding protein [Proteobacteria bacterium]|nr:DNA-binding protein [Pseudomonadota bacterium]